MLEHSFFIPRIHSAFQKISSILLSAVMICAIALTLSGCANSGDKADYPQEPSLTQSSEEIDGIPAERIPGIPAEPISENLNESDEVDIRPAASLSEDAIIRFLDVGQGDSILITCNDQHLLIDGGAPSASSKVYSILQRLGINKLDVVIATHPDADHVGGLAGALNYAECDRFYCTVTEYDTRAFNNILSHLKTPITIPSYGDSFNLGNATVTFINPLSSTKASDNDGSLACILTYGSTKFLFTGDAEETAELAMQRGDYDITADVLKVGHHGSSTSSSPRFLNTVQPKYAIISVGNNSYGHPTDATLQKLAERGIEILRTDELGTITFITNGKDIFVESTTGFVEK